MPNYILYDEKNICRLFKCFFYLWKDNEIFISCLRWLVARIVVDLVVAVVGVVALLVEQPVNIRKLSIKKLVKDA